LRSDPADRERYQRVKRELARRDWRYVQQYADAKTEVVEEIIARARGEAGAKPFERSVSESPLDE
jgi:GrpB-like predicted nucleotidyltransferase (UPF0157 family)